MSSQTYDLQVFTPPSFDRNRHNLRTFEVLILRWWWFFWAFPLLFHMSQI